jgi:hypothetical protein
MPQIGDLLAKLALGQQLSHSEIEELRLQMNKMQHTNSLTAGLVNADGSLDLSAVPINVIYSKTFAVDTPEIVIDVPSRYNNLIMFGLWRSDRADWIDPVDCTLNDDTGGNYEYEIIQAEGNGDSAIGLGGRGTTELAFSGALGASAAAGYAASWFSVLPNIKSNTLYKGSVSMVGGRYDATTNVLNIISSWWNSLERVTKITMAPSVGTNFIAGSSMTVIGID